MNHVRISENPWLADYKKKDDVVFSPASMLCTVLEAGRQLARSDRILQGFELRDIVLNALPVISAGESGIGMFLQIRRHGNRAETTESPWQEFSVYSEQTDDVNVEHCSGLFQIQYQAEDKETNAEDLAEIKIAATNYQTYQAECKRSVNPEDFYEGWKTRDMRWGKIAFLTDCLRNGQTDPL